MLVVDLMCIFIMLYLSECIVLVRFLALVLRLLLHCVEEQFHMHCILYLLLISLYYVFCNI